MSSVRRQDLDVAAALMRNFRAPWCIAGGWALDLFLGQVTRSHADVDIAIFREDQMSLRAHFGNWQFRKVADGVLCDWPRGDWLLPPVHEVHARPAVGTLDSLEFLLNEREGDQWVFRRNPKVTCPVQQVMLHTGSGLPVLSPPIVLLYKAKNPTATDELDFMHVVDSLTASQRQWLRAALQVSHPGHAWLKKL